MPLFMAWKSAYQAQARIRYPAAAPNGFHEAEKFVATAMEKKRTELEGRYGRQRTLRDTLLGLGFIPIWFSNAACLRQMSNSSDEAGSGRSMLAEPRLAAEGQLWVPDLTLPDPLMIMPLFVGLLHMANWWTAGGNNYLQLKEDLDRLDRGTPMWRIKLQRRLFQTFGSTLAVLSGPLLIHYEVPSAAVLYMAASVATTIVQKEVMNNLMKMRKPVEPAVVKKPQLSPAWLDSIRQTQARLQRNKAA